jgi:predicted AAA+ superfamily ATPase
LLFLLTHEIKSGDGQGAEDVLPGVARECYKWLLCPTQDDPTAAKPTVEAAPLNTGGAALASEIQRVCIDNEWVIGTWSPIHLRAKMQALYWKTDKPAFGAMAFWEDTLRYLYLPRLKSRAVLEQAIIKGAASRDFFGTSFGQTLRRVPHLELPPATAPAGSNRSSHGGNEVAEAFD